MACVQAVIDALELVVWVICGEGDPPTGGIVQFVGTTEGELSSSQKDDVGPLLSNVQGTGAQNRLTTLLDENQSPSYDPWDSGTSYIGPVTSGTTNELIADACQEAKDMLADYLANCDDDDDEASAQHARRCVDLLNAFRSSAGL